MFNENIYGSEPYMQPYPAVNQGPERLVSQRIVKLFLKEAGAYHEHYQRPWSVEVTGEDINNCIDVIQNIGPTTFNSSDLSTIASHVIQVDPNMTQVDIPNGFRERKFSFQLIMEFITANGRVTEEILSGFTEFVDITHNHTIDPKMRFFVDSYVVRVRNEHTRNSGIIVGNANLLYNTNAPDDALFGGSLENNPLLQRPEDIFALGSNQLMSNSLSGNLTHAGTLYNTQPKVSTRRDMSPSTYLHDVLQNNVTSVINSNEGWDDSRDRQYNRARNSINSTKVNIRNFTKFMIERYNYDYNGTFTFNDLLVFDPNVDSPDITSVTLLSDHTRAITNYYDMSNGHYGTDITSVTAYASNTIINKILGDSALCQLEFTATNVDDFGVMMPPVVLITNVQSLTGVINQGIIIKIQTALVNELCKYISPHNQIPIELNVSCDIYYNSQIRISINGDPFETFVFAPFATALYSPVINSNEGANRLANNFQTLCDTTVDALIDSNMLSTNPDIPIGGYDGVSYQTDNYIAPQGY